jgi:hypothetical protein
MEAPADPQSINTTVPNAIDFIQTSDVITERIG